MLDMFGHVEMKAERTCPTTDCAKKCAHKYDALWTHQFQEVIGLTLDGCTAHHVLCLF